MKRTFISLAAISALIASTDTSAWGQTSVAAEEASETAASAEDDGLWSFSAGADLVSAYLWRGAFNAGASFQPSVGVSCGPVTLGAWGSTDFSGENKEVDLSLSFAKSGFGLCVTDYFYPGNGSFFNWDKGETCHQLELGVSYDFGEKTNVPLAFSWNSMLAGDDLKSDGDRQFSSYFEIDYSLKVKDVDVEIGAGFTPFDSFYQDGTSGFNMVNLSIKGSYEIEFTDKFHLPVFAQFVLNPNSEDVHMAFGFSF